jgi:MFS family permease
MQRGHLGSGAVYALAALIASGFGVFLYSFSVLIADGAAGEVFSTSVLSLAFGGSVLTRALVSPVVGRMADRYGVRWVFLGGAVSGAVGMAGFAAAWAPWQVLAVWWLVLGPASAAVLYEPAFVALDQWFDRERRIRATATLTVAAGLSAAAFMPLTGWLVALIGWRGAALVLGVLLAAVGSVSVGAFMPNTTRHATAQQPLQVAPRMVLADRRFLVITVAAMVGAGAVEALLVHRVARFAAAGFSVTQITFWAAVAGVLSFPGRILVPRIAASHSGFGLLVVAMAGIVLAALLAVAPSADWIMISHFVVFGLFFGAVTPAHFIVVTDWFSGAAFGRVMGLQTLAVSMARGIAPVLIGISRDQTNAYEAGMIALTLAVTVATITTLAAGRMRPGPLTTTGRTTWPPR